MGAPRVAIVPTGGANLASLADAFERLGARCDVAGSPAALDAADRIVLPGVGAAPEARRRLDEGGLAARLGAEKRPVLGVCLGLQLLFERTAEGAVAGLGVVAGEVRALTAAAGRPVPNMGWAQVRRRRPSRLLDGVDDGAWFYFVHSYAAPPQEDTVAESEHGGAFAAVVERPPFYGTQFHPERSGAAGSRVLANFLELPLCG